MKCSVRNDLRVFIVDIYRTTLRKQPTRNEGNPLTTSSLPQNKSIDKINNCLYLIIGEQIGAKFDSCQTTTTTIRSRFEKSKGN